MEWTRRSWAVRRGGSRALCVHRLGWGDVGVLAPIRRGCMSGISPRPSHAEGTLPRALCPEEPRGSAAAGQDAASSHGDGCDVPACCAGLPAPPISPVFC